jgi:hypothetical protein
MNWKRTAIIAGLGLAAGAGIASFTAHYVAQEELRRAEARALAAQDLIVAERISTRNARAAHSELAEESEHLREQLDAIRETTGSAPEVVERVRWRTREVEIPIDRACPTDPPSSRPTGGDDDQGLPSPPTFSLQVRGLEARVTTRQGNRVALGEVEVWRTRPPPETLLATLPWETRLTQYESTEVGPGPGWAVGPLVGVSKDGVAYGAVVQAKPWRLLGGRVRPTGMVLAGTGDLTAAVGATISW